MVSKRFLFTILTMCVIGLVAAAAVFLAKGYRISPQAGTISGTGIMAVTSIPDQASVYLDGHLTTATNANINSLEPKSYTVRIVKEGYIPWEKKIDIKQGLVSDVKATLFRAIPSIYPITYSGAVKTLLSPDEGKLLYVIPASDDGDQVKNKKSGVWVWPMVERGINFGKSNEPRQIALGQNLDYTKATFRWSADSNQILATFPDRQLLLDAGSLNDPPKDITATVASTIKNWDDEQKSGNLNRLQSIKDLEIRKMASASAVLKWSPDETKLMVCSSDCEPNPQTNLRSNYKIMDLTTKKSYDLPQSTSYQWLPDSEHLVLTEEQPLPKATPKPDQKTQTFPLTKISVIEFDGLNRSEIYVGNFNSSDVFVWPDGSRLLIVTSFPTATASSPNLFGVNLK